jgi:hypothetical protein
MFYSGTHNTSIQQKTAHVFTQGVAVTKGAAQNAETCNFCYFCYTLGKKCHTSQTHRHIAIRRIVSSEPAIWSHDLIKMNVHTWPPLTATVHHSWIINALHSTNAVHFLMNSFFFKKPCRKKLKWLIYMGCEVAKCVHTCDSMENGETLVFHQRFHEGNQGPWVMCSLAPSCIKPLCKHRYFSNNKLQH